MTLAEAPRAFPDWFERLYGLYSAIEADVPSPFPIRPVPVASFRARHVESAAAIPEAFFIALAYDEWIGLTQLQRIELEPKWLQQELTGVIRSHRRRGIATHLKRVGVEWARQHGFVRIRTSNSSRNAGMLAVNERLGYRRGEAVGLWLRDC